jgi:hypothetical protein
MAECTQQPPGVSGESMTPHPCSRCHTRTVPTECTSTTLLGSGCAGLSRL